MNPEELIGQIAAFDALSKQIDKGHLPHSQLFIDSSGFGGLPLAMALAKRLNRGSTSLETTTIWEHPDVHMFFPTISTAKGNPIDFKTAWDEFCKDQALSLIHI